MIVVVTKEVHQPSWVTYFSYQTKIFFAITMCMSSYIGSVSWLYSLFLLQLLLNTETATQVDYSGRNILHHAALNGRLDICRQIGTVLMVIPAVFKSKDWSIWNHKIVKTGFTSFIPPSANIIPIIPLMVGDKSGKTPLHHAVMAGHSGVANNLLEVCN